jgi:ABC-2 type transport system permease protein
MSWARVKAVIWRHIYNFKHSWDRLTDAFYWPAVDILLWGLTSVYIQQTTVNIPKIVVLLLSGLVLWMMVWRAQYEITVNLLEEMWSHNLVNLFATPLTIYEWMLAVVLLGVAKLTVTLGFASGLVYWLYAVNIFKLGWLLLPFAGLLLLFGWAVGFVVAGLIIRLGTRIQTLAWAGIYLAAPFSAIYYPVSSLPDWAQKVAAWLPTSYIFEGMRGVLFKGYIDQANLVKSAALDGLYFGLSLVFFLWMFKQSKKAGLTSLE